jgi:UDP-glucose 4-epimerase
MSKYNNKRILVTGGAGFIGSNLVNSLINKNLAKKIIVLDNYSSGTKKNHINNKKVEYIKGDTKSINKIDKIVNSKFDLVFHLAEFSRIVQSFQYFEDCWESNMQGTKKVIELALKKKAKFVYSASSSKFGNKENEFLSPYAWTKAKNVELIKCYREWYGLEYVISYFYNVYGPNQIRNNHMSAVIGIFENQYINNFPLTVVSPGNQKRDFTHVYDIVDGFIKAGFYKKNQEYQLASGKLYTILQVAKMFKSNIKMIPERPGERFSSKRDSLKKSKKELNFESKFKLKNYIDNFLKMNPKKT